MNENMNPDEFEQRIQHQPVRAVPPDWRSQILSTAAAAARSTKDHQLGSVFTLLGISRVQTLSLLWPSPKVWAGLVAIWLLLAGANRAMLSPPGSSANSGSRPAAGTITAWKEKEQILAELIQPQETSTVQASTPAKPRPRSQLTGRFRMS